MSATTRGWLLILAAPVLLCGCATTRYAGKGNTVFSGRMTLALPAAQASRLATALRAAPSREGQAAWRFDVVSPAEGEAAGGRGPAAGRQWVVSTPTRSGEMPRDNPWDIAHKLVDGTAPGAYRSLLNDLSRSAGAPVTPSAVEPDLVYEDRPGLARVYRNPAPRSIAEVPSNTVISVETPSFHWPDGPHVGWHLDDAHSELHSAWQYVHARTPPGARRIRVAVIDTGYSDNHVANPPFLNVALSRDFTKDPLHPAPGATDPYCLKGLAFPGHGAGVMGVLAGNRVSISGKDFTDYVGGDPDAEIICLRISDSVIHLSPMAMALAIRYAVSNECDVISISHGGLPSAMLADAVNDAYEHGTAIFAAAGDYIELPVLGLATPRMMVYPAAFDRVVSVCGATEESRDYAKPPRTITLLTFRRWYEWMLRGSYGPDSLMDKAIAAYSPNVLWVQHTANGDPHLVRLNGSGTSAATPQVSAAAALWLQLHQDDDFLKTHWRSWEKAEAVYLALFDSAGKNTPEGAHTFTYFGNGLLKARQALDMGVPARMQERRPANAAVAWVSLLVNIVHDVVGQVRAADAPHLRQHVDMIGEEMAQIADGSMKVQARLERWNALAPDPRASPDQVAALFHEIRKDPRCSKYLKQFLSDAERTLAAKASAPETKPE